AWELIRERYEQLCGDIEHPILPPEQAFSTPEDIRGRLASWPTLELATRRAEEQPDLAVHAAGAAHPLGGGPTPTADRIERWLDAPAGERTLLAASSAGRREMLLELLRGRGHTPTAVRSWEEFLSGTMPLAITAAELHEGTRFPSQSLRIITAAELGMERPRQRVRRRRA